MRHVYLITFFVCVLLVSILGFRGTLFTAPPLDTFPEWAFPSMEHQPKYRPQSQSQFFADGRADRTPPAHTVARGMLRDDSHLHAGKDAGGQWVRSFPAGVTIDMKFLERGKDRYQIYCAPCHGALGDGQGMLSKYGMNTLVSNGNYHTDRIRQMSEGEIYNTITNGSASKVMLPYGDKLNPEDRWAVVAYVRALQRAQQGSAADATDAGKKSLGIQ